jgi:phosphoglycolate phosphatase-like HAD superfamily hydrolase
MKRQLLTQTVTRNIKDVYSDALPTAGKLTPSLDFAGVNDLLGAQTSAAISQGIDTAAIAAAVKSGAESANLSAYFNADKVADSTTAKTNVNMNIITKRNARYGQ